MSSILSNTTAVLIDESSKTLPPIPRAIPADDDTLLPDAEDSGAGSIKSPVSVAPADKPVEKSTDDEIATFKFKSVKKGSSFKSRKAIPKRLQLDKQRPRIKDTSEQKSSEQSSDEVRHKKKRRFHPGTVALREIKRMQRSTDTLIPKKSVRRLVREIVANTARTPDLRISKNAFGVLQEGAEDYVVAYLSRAYNLTLARGSTTLSPRDMKTLAHITRDGFRAFERSS